MGMTIDKTIEFFNGLECHTPQAKDARDVAVETMRKYQKLEQEPTAKNDLGVDCVARQDVERFIEGFINEYTPEEELEFINLELNGLKHLPSVTPQEPKTGKWISTETKGVRYAFWCRYKCSLCGGLSDHTNFCPNCGADMREVEE